MSVDTDRGRLPAREKEGPGMEESVLVIHPSDNVGIAKREIQAGEPLTGLQGSPIRARANIPASHKVALVEIGENRPVIKYGETIGLAKSKILAGDWVHTHNLKSERG
jgi:hypothetical protein